MNATPDTPLTDTDLDNLEAFAAKVKGPAADATVPITALSVAAFDVPRLVAEVRRLRADNDELRRIKTVLDMAPRQATSAAVKMEDVADKVRAITLQRENERLRAALPAERESIAAHLDEAARAAEAAGILVKPSGLRHLASWVRDRTP